MDHPVTPCRGRKRQRDPENWTVNIKKRSRYVYSAYTILVLEYSFWLELLIYLGFGSLRTDVCSTCLQHDELLKVEKDISKRNDIMIYRRVHKLRAKAFYDLVREEYADVMTFCFDCQINCPMPKLPDQTTYYSRQLYLYNCTVIQGTSKDNTFAYCWTEDTFAKGSNEIASVVFHRLHSIDFIGIKTVRLIADGCGGQNKNSTMVTMIVKWLTNYAPETVKVVEIVFHVGGHSFIPPDRIFVMIEKDIRKREIIKNPIEYLTILEN
ncbi:unnamed protein product [Pieris brassicae]|uniref:DUF7869 domain-containing protein n=1 Tax=Pieris brassicae TaxID=7116 RepID=A0A9P0XCE6_PIEBR|nr:unnamed protein product [Pieris brassicae]